MAQTDTHDMAGLRVLVVEDGFLIAEAIEEALREHGCEVVGPAARVHRALDLLGGAEHLDGALLDVNLGTETCFPIAAALSAAGIPFVFLTGYGEDGIAPEFRNRPRLGKPFQEKEMLRMVRATFQAGAGE